jgi:hypothetical protein
MSSHIEIPGSGSLRVTTARDVKRAVAHRAEIVREEPQPLEGTRMDLFNSIIPAWYSANWETGIYGTADLADRVWVANRCQQLNSQQIASMPLEFHGTTDEPAWVSNPDPNWYPNGISDALFSIVWQLYGWGFSCQYITDRYADGFARTWTVLPSSRVSIRSEGGRRRYKLAEAELDPNLVVQIDRNPGNALHGTSALSAYAQAAWGLLAAGNQSMSVTQGAVPQALIKSTRSINAEQAQTIREDWMTAVAARNGAPAVLPPELEFQALSFNPADLALLETQEWNSRVLATAYGVPSVLLNMALTGGLTYQNPIALMQMWWLTELRTTSKRVMDAFSAQLLPRGQWVSQDATDITIEGSIEADDDPQAAGAAKASPAQNGRVPVMGGSTL